MRKNQINIRQMTVDRIRKLAGCEKSERLPELLVLMESDPRKSVRALARRAKKEQEKLAKENKRRNELLKIERSLLEKEAHIIAGVDEAGRGPLAGPVAAAAVILPDEILYDTHETSMKPALPLRHLDDSKKLTSAQREVLYDEITHIALAWSVHIIDNDEIDRQNILQASLNAMCCALNGLAVKPDIVLVDGSMKPGCSSLGENAREIPFVKGDSRSLSIAAASVIAKVTRDRIMIDYDDIYPQYGFRHHKGYGAREHILAIHRHGLIPIHRRSFCLDHTGQIKLTNPLNKLIRPISIARSIPRLEQAAEKIKKIKEKLSEKDLAELREIYQRRKAYLKRKKNGSSDEETALLMDEPRSTIDTGKAGEDTAVRYLENEGFTVIERNYHVTEGEIDIIVQKEDVIVFVEVKFSQTGAFGEPETWVTPKKQEKIIKTARSFLSSRDISGPEIRFDVVAIRAENNDLYIRHIPAAFIMETLDE